MVLRLLIIFHPIFLHLINFIQPSDLCILNFISKKVENFINALLKIRSSNVVVVQDKTKTKIGSLVRYRGIVHKIWVLFHLCYQQSP